MSRAGLGFIAFALGLAITSAATAHHPPRMERCKSFTFSGEIERVEWRNPHVELIIRADDGVSHRITWLNMYQLGRDGIGADTLRMGDRVVVTAGTREDVVEQPMLLSDIHRASDGWEWSQIPQGC